MKVLLITSDTVPTSGWGRYSYEVAGGLIAQGEEVIVACERSSGRPYERAVLRPAYSVLDMLRNVWLLRRLIRVEGVALVHALDGWPYGVYAWLSTRGTRTPYVVSALGTYAVAPLHKPGKHFFLAAAYRRARAVVASSRYTASLVKQVLPELPVEVVHLGPSEFPAPDPALAARMREQYRLADSFPVILTVGAIKERKGQFDVVRSLAFLKKKYPNLVYLIVGSSKDSHEVGRIRQFAELNDLGAAVRIIDTADNDEKLSALYSLADVFALVAYSDTASWHFEGLGIAAIDALYFGIPVVGSLDSGLEDVVIEGSNGYLARQQDVQDISRALSRALELTDAARGAEHFSWDATVKHYRAVYYRNARSHTENPTPRT